MFLLVLLFQEKPSYVKRVLKSNLVKVYNRKNKPKYPGYLSGVLNWIVRNNVTKMYFLIKRANLASVYPSNSTLFFFYQWILSVNIFIKRSKLFRLEKAFNPFSIKTMIWWIIKAFWYNKFIGVHINKCLYLAVCKA